MVALNNIIQRGISYNVQNNEKVHTKKVQGTSTSKPVVIAELKQLHNGSFQQDCANGIIFPCTERRKILYMFTRRA